MSDSKRYAILAIAVILLLSVIYLLPGRDTAVSFHAMQSENTVAPPNSENTDAPATLGPGGSVIFASPSANNAVPLWAGHDPLAVFGKDSRVEHQLPKSIGPPEPDGPTESELVRHFRGFQYIRKINEGSSGKVFLFKDGKGEEYAVKIMDKIKRPHSITRHRILLQLELHRRLDSPFICRPHFAMESEHFFYYVMECIKGPDLIDYLNSVQGLSEQETSLITAEIILALECIHREGYIHGDLKLDNVMYGPDGHIRLIDLEYMGKIGEVPGGMLGTLECMAPEVFEKAPRSEASDYFSLGIMVYEMITCKTPFCSTASWGQMYINVRVHEPKPHELLSPVAWDFVLKLLEKDAMVRLGHVDGGALRRHEFFLNVDWERLREHRREPSADSSARPPGQDSTACASVCAGAENSLFSA